MSIVTKAKLLGPVLTELNNYSTWETHLDLRQIGNDLAELGVGRCSDKTTDPCVEIKLALYSDAILTVLEEDFPKLSPYWQHRILTYYTDIYSEAGSRPDVLDRVEHINDRLNRAGTCAHEPLYTTFITHPRVTIAIDREIGKMGLEGFLLNVMGTLGQTAWPAMLLWLDPSQNNPKALRTELDGLDAQKILDLHLQVFDLKTVYSHWLLRINMRNGMDNPCFQLLSPHQLADLFGFQNVKELFNAIASPVRVEHCASLVAITLAHDNPLYTDELKQLSKEATAAIIDLDIIPRRTMAQLGWGTLTDKYKFLERDLNI